MSSFSFAIKFLISKEDKKTMKNEKNKNDTDGSMTSTPPAR